MAPFRRTSPDTMHHQAVRQWQYLLLSELCQVAALRSHFSEVQSIHGSALYRFHVPSGNRYRPRSHGHTDSDFPDHKRRDEASSPSYSEWSGPYPLLSECQAHMPRVPPALPYADRQTWHPHRLSAPLRSSPHAVRNSDADSRQVPSHRRR